MYDSLLEFKDALQVLIDKKLINIKEDEGKKIIILEMLFSDTLFQKDKAFFELLAEELNKDELIQNLVSKVKNLEIKVKNLESEKISINEKFQHFQEQIDNILSSIQKTNKEKQIKSKEFKHRIRK